MSPEKEAAYISCLRDSWTRYPHVTEQEFDDDVKFVEENFSTAGRFELLRLLCEIGHTPPEVFQKALIDRGLHLQSHPVNQEIQLLNIDEARAKLRNGD